MTATRSVILIIAFVGFRYTYGQSIDWPTYGNDPGGKRYTSASQVNVDNVNRLKVAWTFQTGELEAYKGNDAADDAAFEATPVMRDGVIYFSTASCNVFALDAATGKKKWSFHPHIDLNEPFS